MARGRLIVVLCWIMVALSNGFSDTTKLSTTRLVTGIALLGIEYIGGPVLAQSIWWQNGFTWGNPFKHVGETEPFWEDDAWHLVSNTMFTEYHYQVLTRCFRAKHAVPIACALSFVTWTGIEALDALDSRGGWLFSWADERANCYGIAFWLLKHYYPEVPIDIRIGMRKWEKIIDYTGRAFGAMTDYEEYQQSHADNYGILKVEAIYRVYGQFYGGVALSKFEGLSNKNMWGITVGYDWVDKLNGRKKGWWNEPLGYVSRFTAITAGFTYWVK